MDEKYIKGYALQRFRWNTWISDEYYTSSLAGMSPRERAIAALKHIKKYEPSGNPVRLTRIIF